MGMVITQSRVREMRGSSIKISVEYKIYFEYISCSPRQSLRIETKDRDRDCLDIISLALFKKIVYLYGDYYGERRLRSPLRHA
jgi:hypothetical protein